MFPLLISWLAVTVVLMVLLLVRKRLEAREQDWLSLATATSRDIQNQEVIERKVHKLTPIVHWVEALDILLLVALAALWIYKGINTVRW